MSVTYTGKVALITGSSQGIGAAIALHFAKCGANVVVTGRNAGRVSEVAKQCLDVSPDGLKALEVVADVTSDEDLQRLVDTTIATFGKIDIVVNNAAIGSPLSFEDKGYASGFRDTMKANLDSVVFLTHICVKHLEKTNGNIINICSVLRVRNRPNMSAYIMSKTALDMFTKCMAAELGPKGIRVNSVDPGAIKTKMPQAFYKITLSCIRSADTARSQTSHTRSCIWLQTSPLSLPVRLWWPTADTWSRLPFKYPEEYTNY